MTSDSIQDIPRRIKVDFAIITLFQYIQRQSVHDVLILFNALDLYLFIPMVSTCSTNTSVPTLKYRSIINRNKVQDSQALVQVQAHFIDKHNNPLFQLWDMHPLHLLKLFSVLAMNTTDLSAGNMNYMFTLDQRSFKISGSRAVKSATKRPQLNSWY